MVFTNDELGRRVATAFFRADESPGSRGDGVHKLVQDYDILGRVVKYSYFDSLNTANGKLRGLSPRDCSSRRARESC